jgi:hypothetical protein
MPQIQPSAVRVKGYVRDQAGRWRYETTGRYVPGARDITLDSLWRFPRTSVDVLVPIAAIVAPELSWCRHYAASGALRTRGRITALAVPIPDWNDQNAVLLGMDAPELAAHRMVDIERLAAMLDTTPSTIRAYETRGQLPSRTIDGFNSPLWSVPIIVEHLKQRRANQPPKQTKPSASKRTRHHEPKRADHFDDEIDKIEARLAALGINFDEDDDMDESTYDEDE